MTPTLYVPYRSRRSFTGMLLPSRVTRYPGGMRKISVPGSWFRSRVLIAASRSVVVSPAFTNAVIRFVLLAARATTLCEPALMPTESGVRPAGSPSIDTSYSPGSPTIRNVPMATEVSVSVFSIGCRVVASAALAASPVSSFVCGGGASGRADALSSTGFDVVAEFCSGAVARGPVPSC